MKTKPKEVVGMIKVLNSKTKQELQEINVSDRTTTILEIKKFLQKKNLLTQLETKCETLNIVVRRFDSKFNVLSKKGLPGLVSSNDQLVKLEDYCEKLYTIVADNNQFSRIKRHITGKDFLEALNSDLTIKHEVGHFFSLNLILKDIPKLMRYLEGW